VHQQWLAVGGGVEPERRPGDVDGEEAVEVERGGKDTQEGQLVLAIGAVEEDVGGDEGEAVVAGLEGEILGAALDEGDVRASSSAFWRATASMAAEESMPVTSWPSRARARAMRPVPAPTSRTGRSVRPA
jgi:hypothetical protein